MNKTISNRLSKLGILDIEKSKEELYQEIEYVYSILNPGDSVTTEDGTEIGYITEVNREMCDRKTLKTRYEVSILYSIYSFSNNKIKIEDLRKYKIFFKNYFIGYFNEITCYGDIYDKLTIKGVIINNLLNNISIYDDYHSIDSIFV
jgi:hypothetical protein